MPVCNYPWATSWWAGIHLTRNFQKTLGKTPTRPTPRENLLRPKITRRSGLGLFCQVNGGGDSGGAAHYPGGMSVPGQVFSEVNISGSEPMDRSVGKPDFRFPGQGDDVLPPGRHMPIAEVPRGRVPEYDPLGAVQLSPVRMGGRVDFFDMGLAVVSR